MSFETGFDHVDLKSVDPNFTPVPLGEYVLQVVKGDVKEFTYKKDNPKSGTKAGDMGTYISLSFAITDDEHFSGRRIFATLFPGEMALKNLRRLMDATGVTQGNGEPITEWIGRLPQANAMLRATVETVDEKTQDGGTAPKNAISWKTVAPAA